MARQCLLPGMKGVAKPTAGGERNRGVAWQGLPPGPRRTAHLRLQHPLAHLEAALMPRELNVPPRPL